MPDLPQCTAEQVAEVAEAVAIAGTALDAHAVASFLNHPQQTVERALTVAQALGLVIESENAFEPNAPYGFYFSEATDSRRIDVLRFALEARPRRGRTHRQCGGEFPDQGCARREPGRQPRWGHGRHGESAAKDQQVIADKHMGYFRFLGHLRNAADHGQDPDLNMEWEITPEAVQLGALSLLAAIKSVVALVEGQKAEF